MDRSTFELISKVHRILSGGLEADGKLTTSELKYVIGLLEGSLQPYQADPESTPRRHEPWYKRML